MPRSILCKFFAHGACLKGEHCEFSHDWKEPSNMVCTFYSKGACSYGSRCRYDHVKASHSDSSFSSSSTKTHQSLAPDIFSSGHFSGTVSSMISSMSHSVEPLTSSIHVDIPNVRPWCRDPIDLDMFDNFVLDPVSSNPAERSICSFAAAGYCPRGEKCPHIHGELCTFCGKYCLHPLRPDEWEIHMIACEKKQKHLEALKKSQEIECSVCLERVLSKPTAAERKFGLLSECDHPFCISCIRNWRSTSPMSGMDVNSSLRTCPICRKLSYFVIPSVIWYATKDEKQNIVESYKSKLRSINCKHFDFGNGSCPFGTSCFYKHAYRDGRVEEVVLRHLGAEDGETVIAKDIRLSDFLSSLHIS